MFDNPPSAAFEREPNLLLERQPRRGLYVVVAGLSLVAIGALTDFNSHWLQGGLSRFVQSPAVAPVALSNQNELSVAAQPTPSPTPEAVAPTSTTEPAAAARNAAATETPAVTPAAETLVKTSTADNGAEQTAAFRAQVKTFYRRWAETALNTNWAEHAKLYAERVAYYNEGSQARAQVVARKRRVLGGLDKYYLRFAGEPQISFTPKSNPPEAQVTFDKQWDLQRGGQRTAGKSLTQMVLRYENQHWHIVSEKQLKLYHQSASLQPKAKAVEAKSAAKKKPLAPQARRVAQQAAPQRKGEPTRAKKK